MINELEESKRQSVLLENDKRDTSGSNDSLEDHNESQVLKLAYSFDSNGGYQYSDTPSETRILPFTDHYAAELLDNQGEHTHLLEMKVLSPNKYENQQSSCELPKILTSPVKQNQNCFNDNGFRSIPKLEYQLARVSKKRMNLLRKIF